MERIRVGIEKNINDLFDDDGSSVASESKDPFDAQTEVKSNDRAELSRIDLDPIIATPQESAPTSELKPEERREFTRIDVLEKQIQVRFHNQMQFAKQYMENISLGGMFIRTTEKYKMGDIIPVEFQVQILDNAEPEVFKLRGKVCRVIETGVGIEFINLNQVTRTRLEALVQSILPKGIHVRTKAKASTVERLEQLRAEARARSERVRQVFFQSALVLALIVFNVSVGFQVVKSTEESPTHKEQVVDIGGKSIRLNEVRNWKHTPDGKFIVNLGNGESVEVRREELPANLPPQLQQTLQLLQSTQPAQPKRRSKTSNLIKLR